jgi:hypothetical protein
MAARDGRANLGGDIFIHGGSASIGCIAIGDEAAEELFVLTALAGIVNTRVIVSAIDFRRSPPAASTPIDPPWTIELYKHIAESLSRTPIPATITAER